MEPPKDEFVRKATAHQHGGSGTHRDKRDKRRRTRADRDRWAKYDQKED